MARSVMRGSNEGPARYVTVPELAALGKYGSFTSPITSESGTITSASSTNGRYRVIGDDVTFTIQLDIFDAGSGAGAARFNLPYAAAAGIRIFVGRENFATGAMLQGVNTGGFQVSVLRYDNASPIASPRALVISGSYERAS